MNCPITLSEITQVTLAEFTKYFPFRGNLAFITFDEHLEDEDSALMLWYKAQEEDSDPSPIYSTSDTNKMYNFISTHHTEAPEFSEH